MNTPTEEEARKKSVRRYVFRLFLAGFAMSVCSSFVKKNLPHWDLPLWARTLLAISPLLPLVLLARIPRPTGRPPDELERRILQESASFAF